MGRICDGIQEKVPPSFI